MPVTPGSPNISFLDSKIVSDLCAGQFIIDASPSVFIGSGASNIQGIKVQIVNPYGVIIKPYGSTFNIDNPLTENYVQNIPTQAGKTQYGVYTISLQLTDQDGTLYYVEKTANVCTYTSDNYPCDERVRMIASCKNGTLTILVAEPPVFKGKLAQSRTQEWILTYPTVTGISPLTSTNSNWSVQLFQGVYQVKGTVCATYNMGDNVLISLPYAASVEKNVKCLLDYSCIFPRLKAINDNVLADCSEKDRNYYTSLILDSLRLLKLAELANEAGEDASDYIVDLEKLLGCTCTCDCSGSPIVNGTPSTSIAIEGCGVEKQTVGLTDVYTINNYDYVISEDDEAGILEVSAPEIDGCTKRQTISFNLSTLYTTLKDFNNDDANYWASVINLALVDVDPLCLGYTQDQFNAFTLKQKVEALVLGVCNGGNCASTITGASSSQVGSNVELSWTQTGGFSSDVFVDGILKGTVLAANGAMTLIGYGDGLIHDYIIVPRCSNGALGSGAAGQFYFLACPDIAPPVVSSNNVNDAACPYDLTSLVSAPPAGITTEWHTANNTNASSLLGNPAAASSGVYYAFSKNADGCYSTATSVTLICAGASSCTAPQNLSVAAIGSFANFRVLFDGAAFPPPANSYTVKRKLASDPDIDASYTTIGTPTFSLAFNKWMIIDATPSNNVLYTYKAISNCGGTTPSILYDYANITCPSVTLTPAGTTVGYSFSNVGGGVNKYEVRIFDSTGVTQLGLHTIVPAFSSPITGTFSYLTAGTNYLVQVKAFIGTFNRVCNSTPTTTTGGNTYTISYTNNQNIPLQVLIGTGSPSNTVFNGNYTTDPLTGTSPYLPGVNSVVELIVGGGKTILSCTCNGAAGAAGGSTSSWTNVNGPLVINFTTN